MSLSKGDLQAISTIVIDAIDDAKLQTAAGFSELYGKFDGLQEEFTDLHSDFAGLRGEFADITQRVIGIEDTVGRIERVQLAEIDRNDRQDLDILHLRNTMRSA